MLLFLRTLYGGQSRGSLKLSVGIFFKIFLMIMVNIVIGIMKIPSHSKADVTEAPLPAATSTQTNILTLKLSSR